MESGPKKLGIIIAGGLPPPGKLMKRGGGDTSDAPDDEGREDGMRDGPTAMADMWDALKAGDKAGAFEAFCEAMDRAKEDSEPDGDEPSKSSKSY